MSALIWQRPFSIDRRNKRLGNGEARSRRHRINRAVGAIRPRSFRVHANYLDALNASRVRNPSPEAEGTRPQVRLRIYVASLHQGSPASGVLRRTVARLFLCSNGLLRTCPDRNRTNLIGIALYGVAAMAGPKTRVSWRTGCAIIARSTAPAMVSCEKPSTNPVTTPAKR